MVVRQDAEDQMINVGLGSGEVEAASWANRQMTTGRLEFFGLDLVHR